MQNPGISAKNSQNFRWSREVRGFLHLKFFKGLEVIQLREGVSHCLMLEGGGFYTPPAPLLHTYARKFWIHSCEVDMGQQPNASMPNSSLLVGNDY